MTTDDVLAGVRACFDESVRWRATENARSAFPSTTPPDPADVFCYAWDDLGRANLPPGPGVFSRFTDWMGQLGDLRAEWLRAKRELDALPTVFAVTKGLDVRLEESFRRSLDADPEDVFTWNVFLDWLLENGDPRESAVRVLARLRSMPPPLPEALQDLVYPRWSDVRDVCDRMSRATQQLFAQFSVEGTRHSHNRPDTPHLLVAMMMARPFAGQDVLLAHTNVNSACEALQKLRPNTGHRGTFQQAGYSTGVRNAIFFANELARTGRIEPGHLLLAMALSEPDAGTRLLRMLGIGPRLLAVEVGNALGLDGAMAMRRRPKMWWGP